MIIIEPVQGEGGFYVNSKSFMQRLGACAGTSTASCPDADEVQTGAGCARTFFASEQLGIVPDLDHLRQVGRRRLPDLRRSRRRRSWTPSRPGGLGGTYAGSPIACAAALAVLKVFEEEAAERSQALGEASRTGLREIQAKHR